jgi:ABC-type transporter Mla maintaining outer membrane lipid asymmetry ATPase subunit MlaF
VPIVELTGVVKEYRALRPLRIAALSVDEGQRVAVAGLDRNAAELFVNLVNGAVLPDQGRVHVFGRSTADIGSDTEWLTSLDWFGVVTERAVLLEGSTLAQNLALPFSLEIDPMPPDVRRQVEAIAADVQLPADRLDLPIGDAPVPFRLRVHLARAIALGPRLLLLEHPTASLPPGEGRPFAETVLRLALARRMAVIALTEDAAFADIVAEQAYKLNGGTGVLTSTRGWRRWIPSQ